MTPDRVREIFAESLDEIGVPSYAELVRNGQDNSHGGAAALRAIAKAATEAASASAVEGEVGPAFSDEDEPIVVNISVKSVTYGQITRTDIDIKATVPFEALEALIGGCPQGYGTRRQRGAAQHHLDFQAADGHAWLRTMARQSCSAA